MNYCKSSALCVSIALAMSACGNKQSDSQLTASGLNPDDFVTDVNGKTTGL